MPTYATSGTGSLSYNTVPPGALWPGDSSYLWGTGPGLGQAVDDSNVQPETVAVNSRSLSAALSPRPGGGAPAGISVLVIASANPGAAEVDIQTSPSDSDGSYLTPTGSSAFKLTTWTAAAGGQFVSWAELQPLSDHFVSLKLIANPNGVKFTGKLVYV
jgi:hypothetical protein